MGTGTPGVHGTRLVDDPAPPPAGRTGRVAAWVCVAAVVVGLVGVALWAWADPGHYSRSGGGCVSVTFPSSTGGSLMHACGTQAQSLCRDAATGPDRLAALVREQCAVALSRP